MKILPLKMWYRTLRSGMAATWLEFFKNHYVFFKSADRKGKTIGSCEETKTVKHLKSSVLP